MVTGYGDQAYYDGYASLSVLKGDYYLRVAVAPAGAPPSLAAEKQLAAAILPRLRPAVPTPLLALAIDQA